MNLLLSEINFHNYLHRLFILSGPDNGRQLWRDGLAPPPPPVTPSRRGRPHCRRGPAAGRQRAGRHYAQLSARGCGRVQPPPGQTGTLMRCCTDIIVVVFIIIIKFKLVAKVISYKLVEKVNS